MSERSKQAAVPAVLEETVLMGRYCDGDSEAFQKLYALVAPRLLAYLVSLIGERAAAEDLLQQTFLKLHEARALYVREANPVPWLYTIAHRTCLDELRRRKRSRVKLAGTGAPVEPRAQLSGAEEGADDGRAAADPRAAQATLDALAGLPRNQREALVLTKLHGHSLSEAAAIAGTTAGAIKLRAHRAYVALRHVLKREEL